MGSDVEDVFKDVGKALVDVGDTAVRGGVFTDWVVDETKGFIKDITGASAMEAANEQARQRFEEEKAKAEEQRKEVKAETAREQMVASRLASRNRSGTKKSRSTSTSAARFSDVGSDEADFLGL